MPSELEIALRLFKTAKEVGYTDELLDALADRHDLFRSLLKLQKGLLEFGPRQESDRQQLAKLLVTPIDAFDVTVRCMNSLRNSSIRTMGDLVKQTEERMLASKIIGKGAMRDIVGLLESNSLNFGMVFETMDDGEVLVTDWGTPPIRILDRMPDDEDED